ncbi:MAG: ribonuclease Y [Nitrospiraceae bacterium]|nr:ribonuclease Y [Nitrospiraceae bacterium]|tara:strand:+ start:1302 stop:2873 length:1572 start_codon:yes stop_codon:yes gene_type:complete
MSGIAPYIYIGVILVGIIVGFGTSALLQRTRLAAKRQEAEAQVAKIIRDAEWEADAKTREAQLEAKDIAFKAKLKFEQESKRRQDTLASTEKAIRKLEEDLERRVSGIDKREAELKKREPALSKKESQLAEKAVELDRSLAEQRQALERVSGLTVQQAKEMLIAELENEAKFDAAKMIKQIEDNARETAESTAIETITKAVQRVTRDYVSEATISVVQLPNESMKGRIIGKEGRNIRTLEAATGVDLVIDETPEAVIISGFDLMRREVAKISLERLMADGRIHPTRIEEVVERVTKDLEKLMIDEAQRVILELGLHNVHIELVKLLGRLKYRTSYGQNNLMHAREAALISGMMAAELGLDIRLARRGGLMHDIGKSLSHEVEGPHAMIGADVAKKYGESPKVVNAIAAHHEQVDPICPESVLVAAAEALSASRPGARRETLEAYVKRLEKLEKIATGFKGVDKAYAIQAGREVRVLVQHRELSDIETAQISRELAKKVEQELTYPGQIKITVLRESRYVAYAR